MGMYDDIKFEIKCPNCKNKMDNFQSKNGPCIMIELNFYQVDRFYASCLNCNTWVEFNLYNRPNKKITINDYNKTVKIPTPEEQEAHRKKYEEFAKLIHGSKNKNANQEGDGRR